MYHKNCIKRILFEKDSLGINLPSTRTIMSQTHKVYHNGQSNEAKYYLAKYENVKKINYNGEILYNING